MQQYYQIEAENFLGSSFTSCIASLFDPALTWKDIEWLAGIMKFNGFGPPRNFSERVVHRSLAHLALWYSPNVMADFSFYLFRLPNAPGNGDRFFVVKVSTADTQGRTRENRLKKEWATSKLAHFVARTLKSASSAKLIAEIGSDQFLRMKTFVAASLNHDEVIYELEVGA